MKAVQITLDPELLERLDALEEVQREGRSAVLRRLVDGYLSQKEREATDEAYRRAYDGVGEPLGPGWEGWAHQGTLADE